MDDAGHGEAVELVGGLLDGLTIWYEGDSAPRESFVVTRGRVTAVYVRTGLRTAAGATVFRIDRDFVADGPSGDHAGSAGAKTWF